MDLLRTAILSFCVKVSPYMYSARQMVEFVLPNGDVFEGHFISSKNCFVGLRSLLRRYRDSNISVLRFKYRGSGQFPVLVFNSAAVEIEYPEDIVVVRRTDVEVPRIPDLDSYRFVEVFSMEDHLNTSLFSLTARDTSVEKLSVYMPENVYEELEDCVVLDDFDEPNYVNLGSGQSLYFQVGSKCWKVDVEKDEGKWYFTAGCPEFASALNVGPSDNLVFCACSIPYCYEVCLYREFATVPSCLEKGLDAPDHFIKIVTEEFIQKGEVVVPLLFVGKYEHDFENELIVVSPPGVVYSAVYLKNPCRIGGLVDFARDNYIQAGYILIFSRRSKSQIYVSVFDEKMVHINF